MATLTLGGKTVLTQTGSDEPVLGSNLTGSPTLNLSNATSIPASLSSCVKLYHNVASDVGSLSIDGYFDDSIYSYYEPHLKNVRKATSSNNEEFFMRANTGGGADSSGIYWNCGNGNANGPYVHCGFRPAFVMIKCITATSSNWRLYDDVITPLNAKDDSLLVNTTGTEGLYNQPMDFLANGFKIRSTGSWHNSAEEEYIFAAFASQPFKYSNAHE